MKKACCFGHREIFKNIESVDEIHDFKDYLSSVIEAQIRQQGFGIFFTGGRSEFDVVFYAEVRKLNARRVEHKTVLKSLFSPIHHQISRIYVSIIRKIFFVLSKTFIFKTDKSPHGEGFSMRFAL